MKKLIIIVMLMVGCTGNIEWPLNVLRIIDADGDGICYFEVEAELRNPGFYQPCSTFTLGVQK